MYSTSFYNFCTAGYVFSLGLFAFHVINSKPLVLRIAMVITAFSFLLQTGGMALRWLEAGLMEVQATESAIGQALKGWSWFVVFTQHPPWSNLYEIMIYMSWGIIMVVLAIELRFGIAWVRQMGIILALMALGVASLTDASIMPLVPALKSWWIMIHVISASVAYAAGFIAAFLCLFALMKDESRVLRQKFFGMAFIFLGFLLFCLAGGPRLIFEQVYLVRLLAFAGTKMVGVSNLAQENGVPHLVPMPGMGYLFLGAIVIHLVCGLSLLAKKNRILKFNQNYSLIASICFISTFFCLAVILFHDLSRTHVVIHNLIANHLSPAGPWFIGFKSHPWSLGLLIFTLVIEGWFLFYLLNPKLVKDRLPAVEVLENASYKTIALSFFLMTVVLLTGCLWAHYAWGRYWAWDPKETGALAIWINYAIYLHSRRTSGLSGPISSVIGILGFFVIIVGFLGVNLGLFSDGLHTYGNG